MTIIEHVWTPKFQHHYPCSNREHLASEASALTTELRCITFEENFLSEGHRFVVAASFLQFRVMGKINADTAILVLLLLFLRRRRKWLKQAVSIWVNIEVMKTQNPLKTNTDLFDSIYFMFPLFFLVSRVF